MTVDKAIDMTTLTKHDLAEALHHQLVMSQSRAKQVAEGLINILQNSILNKDKVMLKGVGKLVVAVKAERIGRNPKTCEPALISKRHAVTATSRSPAHVCNSMGTSVLRNRIGRMCTLTVAAEVDVVDVFYDFLALSLSPDTRIELRGLGVFSSRTLAGGRQVRNPKNGTFHVAKERTLLTFKCSPSLREELDAKYL